MSPTLTPINDRPAVGKHRVISVVVFTACTVVCACNKAAFALKEPGVSITCPVCQRTYVVVAVRYDINKGIPGRPAQVEVDIAGAEPTILRPT